MLSKRHIAAVLFVLISFFSFAQDGNISGFFDSIFPGDSAANDLSTGDLSGEDLSDEDLSDWDAGSGEINAWKENAETNSISQPFAWESAGDVLKYEIIIYSLDKETGRAGDVVYRHETDDNENETCLIYIDPVLPPGDYRSEIRVYNVLGGLESDLGTVEDFTVLQAHKPEIRNVSYPLFMRSIIYLDDLDNNGIVDVEGRNLFEPPESEDTLVFTEYSLKSDRRTVRPKSVVSRSANGRKISLQFPMRELDVGEYNMFAQDASGLHSEESNGSHLTVKFKKLVDVDVEAGYFLPVILHDDTIKKYLDENVFPIAFQTKVTVVPMKHVWGYLGVGLRFSYNRLKAEYENYSIDGNLWNLHALFVCQLPFLRRRFFVEPHLGAGLTYFNNIQFHFPHDINSRLLDTLSLSFDAGASLMYYFNKRLYAELAVDYVITVNADMNMGAFMPSVGIGWQF